MIGQNQKMRQERCSKNVLSGVTLRTQHCIDIQQHLLRCRAILLRVPYKAFLLGIIDLAAYGRVGTKQAWNLQFLSLSIPVRKFSQREK